MRLNPYRYKGPLDPVKDQIVCVPRREDLNKVINGIMRGDYWAVLGPRQIGKTTFLRQLKNTFTNAHYIYFDFEVSYSSEEDFYRSMMDKFLSEIPFERKKPAIKEWKDNPELKFFEFLKKFNPKDDTKIILLFDEIDNLPFLRTFLHLWRMVYHERYHKDILNRYAVIITGSLDLIALTIGKNSPFNIAETFYIKDFSDDESEKLIEKPFKHLNLKIENKAKQELLSQVSGHPQLLQQACHILVDNADEPDAAITEKEVNNAIDILFVTNSSLDTLKQDVDKNESLRNLIDNIFNGKKKKYYSYKELSLAGAGSIVERSFYCTIRNKVYEKFLKGIFEDQREKSRESEQMQQALIKKIQEGLDLLTEYEDKLSDKNAHSWEATYKNDIKNLKNLVKSYREEYNELVDKARSDQSTFTRGLHTLLESMNKKLNTIIEKQINIHSDLSNLREIALNHFEQREQKIIAAVLDRLNQLQVKTVNNMIDFIEKNSIQKHKTDEIFSAVESLLDKIQKKEIASPGGIGTKEIEYFSETIGDTNKDVKHRLKLSLPIIPLFLSYEGESEFKSLKKVWDWLKGKVTKGDTLEKEVKEGD